MHDYLWVSFTYFILLPKFTIVPPALICYFIHDYPVLFLKGHL